MHNYEMSETFYIYQIVIQIIFPGAYTDLYGKWIVEAA